MHLPSLAILFLVSIFIAYRIGLRSNVSKYEKSIKAELNQYKTIIHHLSDAMHNLGSAPLKEKSDINKVFLSPDDAEKIRALFRILRRFSTLDLFESTKEKPPYQEIINILSSVASQNSLNSYSIEQICALENASFHGSFHQNIKNILSSENTK